MAQIPTTILTGFLGAGKTTLLNRILQEKHGHRIAVIENEFGQENIDSEILLRNSNEQIVEMNNGCVCCTVRGDLVVALTELAKKRKAGELQFDRIVIETTGLANPTPVAQTFFLEPEVAAHYQLDAIVTVVDARHGLQQMDEHEEAQCQAGFADRLLLSKTDLVGAGEIESLTARLRHINPQAPIGRADFGRTPIDELLDIRGFNLSDRLEIAPDFLSEDPHRHGHHHDGEHCDDADCGHDHSHAGHKTHLADIAAFVFKSVRPFDSGKLEAFLNEAILSHGPHLLRYKGVLSVDGIDHKIVLQGVHQMMSSDFGARWPDEASRESKMIFIGRNLPKEEFLRGLESCLV